MKVENNQDPSIFLATYHKNLAIGVLKKKIGEFGFFP